MQTFLPNDDISARARALDLGRPGTRRVETLHVPGPHAELSGPVFRPRVAAWPAGDARPLIEADHFAAWLACLFGHGWPAALVAGGPERLSRQARSAVPGPPIVRHAVW
jgi:hypothetical protein